MKYAILLITIFFVVAFGGANLTNAQTTEFTYQGRLADGGQTANGNYDFEFRLFDAETGGTEIATQQRLVVSVTAGIFSVKLDFGGNFNGQARFLEIGVRPAGSTNAFTVLAPRQPFTSTPYAVKSLNAETAANALQLNGTPSNQFVLTTDPRMTDERNPLAGSANYIQNTTTQQTNSNFSISGNGVLGGTLLANSVISQSSFSIINNNGLNPVLSIAGTNNLFVGSRSGENNTSGTNNAFFGANSGILNTTGSSNSFFGSGQNSNLSGNSNSFFGSGAGGGIRTGSNNTFLGASTFGSSDLNFATALGAGAIVSTSNTVVLGRNVDTVQIPGALNIGGAFTVNIVNAATQYNIGGNRILSVAGEQNLFAGVGAGQANTSSFFNTFVGSEAGTSNTTGSSNSLFGTEAGFSITTGGGNSFFGVNSGRQTTGNNNSFFGNNAGRFVTTGSNNTAIGSGSSVGSNISFATAIGSDAQVSTSNTVVLGRNIDTVRVPGFFILDQLGTAGVLLLCRNASQQISPCSSSLRYKTNIAPFLSGLNLVNRLRPITFDWKTDGTRDLGLGAEEVAAVEPLLVTYNQKGEVEGVKYDRVAVVLLNAVKEQQVQIEIQQKLIEQQQTMIDGLKKIVCGQNPNADVCRGKQK